MSTSQKFYLPIKRLIDILGSIAGIIVCFAFLWWWVFIINVFVTRGHPFFKSNRVGRNGKSFDCLKFRSMKNNADPNMTSRDKNVKHNLTTFGRFLRKTSIDETPQLLNIFIGQMSFIGPRPLIYKGDDTITIDLRKENGSIALRPGLSGQAQLHNRGVLDPVEKANQDYQ